MTRRRGDAGTRRKDERSCALRSRMAGVFVVAPFMARASQRRIALLQTRFSQYCLRVSASPRHLLQWRAGGIDGLDSKGFLGATFDGRYIYYVPYGQSGVVLRFDTRGRFTDRTNWVSFDAGALRFDRLLTLRQGGSLRVKIKRNH